MATAQSIVEQSGIERVRIDPLELRKKILSRDITERKQSEKERKFQLEGSSQGRKQLRLEKYKKGITEKQFKQRQALPGYLKGTKKKVSVSKAISGLAQAMINPQIMSEQQFYGSAPAGRSSGAGRGRPSGSFTPKMLPSGQMVNMPVQAYKRAVSMQKAQMRMQAELAKARMSMQPSQAEMPRGYGEYDTEDKFLDTEDQSALQEMQMRQMMQQQARGQPQAAASREWSLRNLLRPSQPQYPEQQFVQRPPMSAGTGPVQRLNIWGGTKEDPRNNILNAPNVFNKPREASIGVARKQQQQFY
jgi:hypothetical protein